MEFEWDAAKSKKNRQKHGLGFEIAKSVFNDPRTVTFPDPTHSEMEERRITIGASDTGQILLIVHTVKIEFGSSARAARHPRNGGTMKDKATMNDDEMLPEYDLTGRQGVRGKYHRAYRQGHKVTIREEDGSASVQYFGLEDGAVMLDPDVRRHFHDSESVNTALRSLIPALTS